MTYRCAHMRSTRSASNALVRAGQLDRPSARPPRDAASEGPWPPDTTSSPSPTAPPSSCPRASPGPAYRRADHQHELPARVTVLADAVRLRDLGEREGLRDREREAPGLDQLTNLGERVDRATSVPAAEPHPVLLRATEVGDRHDVLGPQRAKVLVVCRTGGADHARTAHHGELNRGAADASGGAVDEQRAAV